MSDFHQQSNPGDPTNNSGAPRPVVPIVAETDADTAPDALPRMDAPGHDNQLRQTVPERERQFEYAKNEPLSEPREPTRLAATGHDESERLSAVGRDSDGKAVTFDDNVHPGFEPRTATVDEEQSEQKTDRRKEEEPRVTPEPPPDSTDLVTVEEAVTVFRERGLPRHIRTIQKYCARKSAKNAGRALICYQVPTENGIRYMIDKTSIDRFISDATHQAPTGEIEPEPVVASIDRGERRENAPQSADRDIFQHPYVKRLEGQVERLEGKNDHLQGQIQIVLENANQALIELQKANAVAQSETLGTFLLEAERIRGGSGENPVQADAEVVPEPDVQQRPDGV